MGWLPGRLIPIRLKDRKAPCKKEWMIWRTSGAAGVFRGRDGLRGLARLVYGTDPALLLSCLPSDVVR